MPSGLVLISSDVAPTARRRLLLHPGSCGVVKRESLRAGADRGEREPADLEDERLALLCLSTDERLVVVRMSKRTPIAIRSAARRDGHAATRLTLEGVGDAAAVPLEDCVVRRAPPSVLSSLVPPPATTAPSRRAMPPVQARSEPHLRPRRPLRSSEAQTRRTRTATPGSTATGVTSSLSTRRGNRRAPRARRRDVPYVSPSSANTTHPSRFTTSRSGRHF